MPVFATKPMTTLSKRPVDIPQNYVVGQQWQQISELQFDKFPYPQPFMTWKTRFKTQGPSGVLIFHRMLCCGSKKGRWLILWIYAKILTISLRERFSGFWDVGREDCLGSEQDHPEFPVQERSSASWSRKPKKRIGSWEGDKAPSWFTTTFEWLALMAYSIRLCWFLLGYSSRWQRYGTKFCYWWQKFHPMISWKVCTN